MKSMMLALCLAAMPLCACALDGTSPEALAEEGSSSSTDELAPSRAGAVAPSQFDDNEGLAPMEEACSERGKCPNDAVRSASDLAECRAEAKDAACGEAFRLLIECEKREIQCDRNGKRVEQFTCTEEAATWATCKRITAVPQ